MTTSKSPHFKLDMPPIALFLNDHIEVSALQVEYAAQFSIALFFPFLVGLISNVWEMLYM
jgi:hypothetical protein